MRTNLKILVFVLINTLMLCSLTYAEDTTLDKTLEAVERTNLKIESTIEKSVNVADTLVNNGQNPDVIINNLIRRAEQMTAVTIENSDRKDVTVVCDYVEVEIGGKTVLVDPCRVINY